MANQYDLSDLGGSEMNDLSDLGGKIVADQVAPHAMAQQAMQQPASPNLLDRLIPPQLWAQNFDKGLQHSFFVPGTDGNGLSYTLGDITGNAAQFIAGGEALDTLRGAAEAIPYVGKIAKALGGDGLSGVARRAIGSGGYAAATNPNDMAKSGGEAALLSSVLDSIPYLGSISNAIRPQKHTDEMLATLGAGKSLEANAQSLAESIKNSYNNVYGQVKEIYKPIFDDFGNEAIYSTKNSGSYKALDKEAIDGYDRDLKKLHNKFSADPTLQNAHDLQSELGTTIRKLQANDVRGHLSVSDRSRMQGYQDARNAVRNDIDNFLASKDPNAATQYHKATEDYAERVAPYLENSKIAPIAKGNVTNPKNITAIFQNPEPELLQIVNEAGGDVANKILYSELGKYKNPEALAKAIGDLDKKGLNNYVTPEFQRQAEALSKKIGARNLAQKGTGAALGGLYLGTHGGLPLVEALGIGGAAGALAAPIAANFANKIPGANASAKLLADAISAGYRPASKAVIANIIKGND